LLKVIIKEAATKLTVICEFGSLWVQIAAHYRFVLVRRHCSLEGLESCVRVIFENAFSLGSCPENRVFLDGGNVLLLLILRWTLNPLSEFCLLLSVVIGTLLRHAFTYW